MARNATHLGHGLGGSPTAPVDRGLTGVRIPEFTLSPPAYTKNIWDETAPLSTARVDRGPS